MEPHARPSATDGVSRPVGVSASCDASPAVGCTGFPPHGQEPNRALCGRIRSKLTATAIGHVAYARRAGIREGRAPPGRLPYDHEVTESTEPAPSPIADEIQFSDNPAMSRYEARLGERVLGIVDYELDPDAGRITLVHTGVMPDAEGMGVGTRLAKGALEDVRARGLKLRVDCKFIAAYLKRHPGEYTDLTAG